MSSGLHVLASKGVPIGKVQTRAAHVSQAAPRSGSAPQPACQTPVPITVEVLESCLKNNKMAESKILGCIGLLNNRTSAYFSTHIGAVFPGLTRHHPSAIALLQMPRVQGKARLTEALRCLEHVQVDSANAADSVPRVAQEPEQPPRRVSHVTSEDKNSRCYYILDQPFNYHVE